MLWFMHFLSFLINRNSFNKKFFDDPEIDDFKKYNKDPTDALIYRPVVEQFKTTKSLWLVQGLVYFFVLYVYSIENGSQLIADLWIPLDFLIFLSMAIYAFICHRKDQTLKSRQDKI